LLHYDGLGWVKRFQFAMGWVGLGHPVDGLSWVGWWKINPRTTLLRAFVEDAFHSQYKSHIQSRSLPTDAYVFLDSLYPKAPLLMRWQHKSNMEKDGVG